MSGPPTAKSRGGVNPYFCSSWSGGTADHSLVAVFSWSASRPRSLFALSMACLSSVSVFSLASVASNSCFLSVAALLLSSASFAAARSASDDRANSALD